jgi:integrase/recombinase XerC
MRSFLEGRNQRTMRAYTFDLEDFAGFVGASGPGAAVEILLAAGHGVANRMADAYRADMIKRGLQASTVNRRLSALRAMVKVARRIGRVAWALDVEGMKSTPYRDTRGPGLAGWRAILAKATQAAVIPQGKRDLALIRLMHDHGLRRGECCALTMADISLDSDPPTISIIGKGQTEPIRLTLAQRPREALEAWLAERGNVPGPVFIRLDPGAGQALELKPLTGDSVWRIVQTLSRRAGLKNGTRPHGLRHQGITRALDLAGGDVRKVQRFSRHAKIETVMRYDDARRDDAGHLAAALGNDE